MTEDSKHTDPKTQLKVKQASAELQRRALTRIQERIVARLDDALRPQVQDWVRQKVIPAVEVVREKFLAYMREWAPLIPVIAWPWVPGTFLGDIVAIAHRDDTEALYRLAGSTDCSQSSLFKPIRWRDLEAAFAERIGERRWDTAWRELVANNVFVVIKEILPDTPMRELYREFHRRLRRSIEEDLLDGQTADDHYRHRSLPWPEEETLAAIELEKKFQAELLDWCRQVEDRVDIQRVLAELDPKTGQALELHGYAGLTLKEAAFLTDLEPATLRQRLSRVRRRQGKR